MIKEKEMFFITTQNLITKEKKTNLVLSIKEFCDSNNLNHREIKKQLLEKKKKNISYLVVRVGSGITHTFEFSYKV